MLRKVNDAAYTWVASEAFGTRTGSGRNVQAKNNHVTCIFSTKKKAILKGQFPGGVVYRRGNHADVPGLMCASS